MLSVRQEDGGSDPKREKPRNKFENKTESKAKVKSASATRSEEPKVQIWKHQALEGWWVG